MANVSTEEKLEATNSLVKEIAENEPVTTEFSEDQLNSVELTKTQINTVNDLRKVMKPDQLKDLINDFKKANLVKQQSGEKRLREASTEFTKEHAVIYAEVMRPNSNLNEIATRHSIELTAIPNVIREIKAKLFTILSNEGQINKDVVTELLKKHATAEPRKKRDKKVQASENGITDATSNDDENDDENDDDDDANAGTEPTFTAEELAALESGD